MASDAIYAQTAKEVAHLSGSDRQQLLEKGAKNEGTLTLYTSLIVDQAARPLKAAFETKYPFIKLNYTRADSTKLVQRIFAETRAGASKADVVVASTSAVLHKAGLLQSFKSPMLDNYPDDYVHIDNLWAAIRFSYNGIAYNTDRVPKAEAPRTWEDLLDPKWKGRIVWGSSLDTGGPLAVTSFIRVHGKDAAESYFDKLAKQNVAAASGSIRAILDQVIAGQYDVMISAALHHVMISSSKGAPIWFSAHSPVIARPDHVQLLRSAPHPHAAMLFVDFLMSEEGQKILKEAGYIPAHPNVEPPKDLHPIIPAMNGKKEVIITPADTLEMQKPAMQIFERTSR
jgi:iron(III) transport system substrate-binding protein